MGETQYEESEAIDKQISSNTEFNSKQIVEKINERPEWLPEGWNVDFRTRKSGPNMGYGYKCYINPHGKKFYSKLEVFRYLESIKGNDGTSKMEEDRNTVHSLSNDAVGKSQIERSTAKKSTIGKSKIEKSTAKKSTIEKSRAEKPSVEKLTAEKSTLKKSMAEKASVDKSTTDKSTDEDLPPGWIKEVKIRKSGNSSKKDWFYTDPVSGYVFRSKKDALRFIESGDISSCAIKPNKRQIQDEDKLTPTSPGKKQKQKQSDITPRQLFVGKSGLLENGVANPPKMQKTSDPDDVQENRSNPSLSKKELAHRSSRRLAGVEPDQSTSNLINEQTLPVPKRNLRKGRTVLDSDIANKSSQQLNGASETGKVGDNKPDNPHNSQGLASGGNFSSTNKSSDKKGCQFPCRSSKRLAGFGAELTSNSLSYETAPEYKSKKSKGKAKADFHHSAVELVEPASINGEMSNKSRKSYKFPPIIDDQLEKHENGNMNDETSELQQSFAFHYSWSDPSLELAINTLTSTLPVQDSDGKRPTVISKTDKFPENNLSENVTGSREDKKPKANSSKSNNNKANSSKSNNKKLLKSELEMPKRLSKRLAGHEPDVLPAERAVEYSSRKSCKDKPNADAVLTDGESAHLHVEEYKHNVHASDSLKTNECGESSNANKSYDAENVPDEQLNRLEAGNINEERSEPQFPVQFGESWSDPCVEFAIKTLTGALPVDAGNTGNLPVVTPDANDPDQPNKTLAGALPVDAADGVNLPVITPDANDPPNKESPPNLMQNSKETTHDYSNHCHTKQDLNTVWQPSEQLQDQPELKTSSPSCENDPKFGTQESCGVGVEVNVTRNLDGGQPLRTEGGNVTLIDINTLFFDEPFMENEQEQLLGVESIAEQQQPETETTNQDNSERDFCTSFMDSWSDPCLEFAFKTLTGALPVDENIAMQGSFQEPANNHEQRGGSSTLPEIGSSSSISQSDRVEKPVPGQQTSMNSSFVPQEIPNLNGFPGVDDTQNYYSQWNNNNFQRR